MWHVTAGDLKNIDSNNASKAQIAFKGQEIYAMISWLRHAFDLVRLVDPGRNCELKIDGQGRITEVPCAACREENEEITSASMRALNERTQITKFKFVDNDLYHITVKYVEVDGRPSALEMVSCVAEEIMLDGIGKHEIVEKISRHNTSMYVDPVTGVNNRRYYEDYFQYIRARRGVAMIDVDNFKTINDTFGHAVGDQVLRAIGEAITACVRPSDVVIRYGGDEFVIIFDGIPRKALHMRLEAIRNRVRGISFEEHPQLRTSLSVGGAYGEDSIAALLEEADRMMYQAKEIKDSVYTSV